jgi:hypothetical protein
MLKDQEIEFIFDETVINPIGFYGLGLVKSPAINEKFVLNSDEKYEYSIVNRAKKGGNRMIYSPIMIPEQRITEYSEDGIKYFSWMSADTIRKLTENFMKNYNQKSISWQHDEQLNGEAIITEIWIVEDEKNDKLNALGFKVPAGTTAVGVKIYDDVLWEKIENKLAEGLSIEAFLPFIQSKNSKNLIVEIDEILEDYKK